MVVIVRDRIQDLIKKNKTLVEIKATRLPRITMPAMGATNGTLDDGYVCRGGL